jgi:hypothetical protein
MSSVKLQTLTAGDGLNPIRGQTDTLHYDGDGEAIVHLDDFQVGGVNPLVFV